MHRQVEVDEGADPLRNSHQTAGLISNKQSRSHVPMRANSTPSSVSTSASVAFNLGGSMSPQSNQLVIRLCGAISAICSAQFVLLLGSAYRLYSVALQGAPEVVVGWMFGLYFGCASVGYTVLGSSYHRSSFIPPICLALFGSVLYALPALPNFTQSEGKGMLFGAFGLLGVAHGWLTVQFQSRVFRASLSLEAARHGMRTLGLLSLSGTVLGAGLGSVVCDPHLSLGLSMKTKGGTLVFGPVHSPAHVLVILACAMLVLALFCPNPKVIQGLSTARDELRADLSPTTSGVRMRYEKLVGPQMDIVYHKTKFQAFFVRFVTLLTLTVSTVGQVASLLLVAPLLVEGDVCGSPFYTEGCVYSQQQIFIFWTMVAGFTLAVVFVLSVTLRGRSLATTLFASLLASVVGFLMLIDWGEKLDFWAAIAGFVWVFSSHIVCSSCVSAICLAQGWWGGGLVNVCSFFSTTTPFWVCILLDDELNHRNEFGPSLYFGVLLFATLVCVVLVCLLDCAHARVDHDEHDESRAQEATRLREQAVQRPLDHGATLFDRAGVPVFPHPSLMLLSLVNPNQL